MTPPGGPSGEGEHWLLKREQPRRRIDAEAVVAQAHALVHDGGTAALTMRPLAASLGTSTSALYRIVPSKEWLLVAIVDLVFSEVDTSVADADGTSGRQRLERLSIALRDVMAAHPHLHAVLTSHVAITPSTVRVAESSLSCLRGMGIADPDLVDAYNSWLGYVIGFTAVESMPPEHEPDPQLWAVMRAHLDSDGAGASIVSELMPDIANRGLGLSWLPASPSGTSSSFAWGLALLLDGLEARGTTRAGRSWPTGERSRRS
jgi:AcrR family transcriptional regulator